MKIDVRQIPPAGAVLEDDIDPAAWELDADLVKLREPLKARADISKVTNVVTALIKVEGRAILRCSRCLKDFPVDFKRDIRIDSEVDASHLVVDFDPEIRDQLILGYPVKPLCRKDCRGLCPVCGKDLNLGDCNCSKTRT
ncbi:MAG: DUF177 domain-containing protein [Candidatus Omnitrophota bacterium]